MENHSNLIKVESNEQYSGNMLGLDGAQPSGTPIPGDGISSSSSTGTYRSGNSKQRWNESAYARARRLARNAERMRERRARESEDEYRRRLARNAEANRVRRQNETEVERAMRLVRNAARQRLRRAMESPDQRSKRLAKLAERMRIYRANETPDQRKERLAEMAARARERIARESSEERRERLRKLSEYAKKNQNQSGVQPTQGHQHPQPQQAAHMQHQQVTQAQLQEDDQHHQHQNYVQQTLTNSIEYYQNMFIQSALRPNLIKENQNLHSQQQTENHHQQSQQSPSPVRFSQNIQNISMDSNSASPNLFQQNLYDTSKSIQKFHHPPYQTLTNTIEYYQNKFIKGAKNLQNQETQTNKSSISLGEDFDSPKDLEDDRIKKHEQSLSFTHQQQLQTTPTALYNQFSYLNNFSTMSTSPAPVPNQQNYYPTYHNGFQLSITPNSAPPPFTPVHFQNSTTMQPQSHGYQIINSPQNQQMLQDYPKPVRGRPRKVFPDSDITRIPPELQDEAIRQQKVNAILENEINQILTQPKRHRGRPGRGQETDEERRMRLDKVASHQRRVRANESPEERAVRLKNLSERARMKRAQIRATETEEQRRHRLSKQAEYARQRRIKAQTPEHKRRMEERAKELYAQLHNLPPPQSSQQQGQAHLSAPTTVIPNDDFVKNSTKDFTQSENDVLKILEPIIVMKAK